MPQGMPPPKPSLISRLLPFIVLVVIVGGIAGAYFLFRDQLTGNVAELRVGDCFDEPANAGVIGAEVEDIQHRPCNEPHDAEVFMVFDYTGATYPTSEERQTFVTGRCLPEFQTYTGTSYEAAEALDVAWFYPTTEGWNDRNDREFSCYIVRVDGGKLNASVKGAVPSE